jgi:MerR family redox-sensitive transcriptional activator SoxR
MWQIMHLYRLVDKSEVFPPLGKNLEETLGLQPHAKDSDRAEVPDRRPPDRRGRRPQRRGPSALRFYESLGLIRRADGGGHRVYPSARLRRVAFIRSRSDGCRSNRSRTRWRRSPDRAPTKAQWANSAGRRAELDERIGTLERLRDDLTSCIGCGCLSLQTCGLYNPQDVAATRGTSARYLLGDDPAELVPELAQLDETP